VTSPLDRPEGPIRVLIVEDAMDHALLLVALLKGAGNFETTQTQDGGHAIQLMKDREFDLVVTDLNLPGTDGFAVIRAAKAAAPDRPVLATTGFTNPGYVDEAFRAGADEMILKPLDRDDLVMKLKEVLKAKERPEDRPVLAVGVRPGDVELGCGGILHQHRSRGQEVLIITLTDDRGVEEEGARAAAERLGARIIAARAAVGEGASSDDVQRFLERVVKEMRPSTVYAPPSQDADAPLRDAHRITRSVSAEVPNLYAYFTATTGLDYRPTRFVDVEKEMGVKLELLTVYNESGRPDLAGGFAQGVARYWGRFAGFSAVEPLEVLRTTEKDV
jgi:CheY-like chemotaxis protein